MSTILAMASAWRSEEMWREPVRTRDAPIATDLDVECFLLVAVRHADTQGRFLLYAPVRCGPTSKQQMRNGATTAFTISFCIAISARFDRPGRSAASAKIAAARIPNRLIPWH
jgi:hypothetical protein